jgi:hypothetical protein
MRQTARVRHTAEASAAGAGGGGGSGAALQVLLRLQRAGAPCNRCAADPLGARACTHPAFEPAAALETDSHAGTGRPIHQPQRRGGGRAGAESAASVTCNPHLKRAAASSGCLVAITATSRGHRRITAATPSRSPLGGCPPVAASRASGCACIDCATTVVTPRVQCNAVWYVRSGMCGLVCAV